MCMNQSLGDASIVDSVVDANGLFIIPPNPNRAAITVLSPAFAAMTVFIGKPVSGSNGGSIINPGDRPLLIHQFFHGTIVRMQHLIIGFPGDTFAYIEVLNDS